MIDLPETERSAVLLDEMLEKHGRVVSADTLHAAARFLNFIGEHSAAEALRTDLRVFRFMRKETRDA